ncbi:MAG: tetratricopeptide repeat protein [Bacilli bacterium]
MDNEIKKKLVLAFSNHHIDDVVKVAYELKPFNGMAVESAKLICEWFSKEKECNFTKMIDKFLYYADYKKNEFASVCYYMAAKICLFYKKDVNEAIQIVRKAYLQDEIFLGTSFIGHYIYQYGMIDGNPDYLLARQYLIDSVNFEIPWLESSAILDKRGVNDKFKLHYAKKVMEYSNNEEFIHKALAYLLSYYHKNNFLEELFVLYEENKDALSIIEENKEEIASSLYRLGKICVANKDYSKGVKCYEYASSLENEKAIELLGIAYYQGTLGLKKNIEKSLSYLLRIKRGGTGMMLLALLYEKGEGVSVDKDKSFDLYLKCSKEKVPEAFFRLGKIYCEGTYKNRDEYLAHRYFEEYKEIAKEIPLVRLKMIDDYYDSFKR